MKLNLFILLCLTTTTTHLANGGKMRNVEAVFQWNLLEFGFPTMQDRQQAMTNGNLVAANGVPIDVAVQYGNGNSRIFTTIPRFATGIPYTLATVSERREANGPILQPYPNYSWHSSHGADCDGITSAFRVDITECNQMWVIDSGIIGSTQHCPPQLLLFDLNTDLLVHRYRFDANVTPPLYIPMASLFITPIAVVADPPPSGTCRNTKVYVADVNYHGLVVYDYQQNTAWRVENKNMYPDPTYGTHFVAGENFTLMDGIFGMTSDKQNLYFHPLASNSEYAVPLSVLDTPGYWAGAVDGLQQAFRKLGSRSSECAAEAIDGRGNIYCVTLQPIRLISWNVNTPYRGKMLRELPINPQMLEFVSGMKVVKNNLGKEELWMMSNRFQKIAVGSQNQNQVNYRILRRHLDDVQYIFNDIDDGTPNKNLHHKLVFN